MRHRWDIFCTVIDNFGDVGVCWRLARQLASEHHQTVRLWVDDLNSFAVIAPAVNSNISRQIVHDIEIFLWHKSFPAVEPAEVVIEAFACELPESYVIAMVQKNKPPVWINMEYLSAEPWVAEYHAVPSPYPRFPLTKTCFFPGFVEGTGGLLREKNLITQRQTFNASAEREFLQRKGLPGREPDELRMSLFGYDSAPIEKLMQILAQAKVPVLLIVPQGKVAEKIVSMLNPISSQNDVSLQCGYLTVQVIPFMEQTDYDRLLWCCDINFVRGEDSFVRAQWGGNPFIWNIYPQKEGVHWKKLHAFLDLYCADMTVELAVAVREMWFCWNGIGEINHGVWMNFLSVLESLKRHNGDWRKRLLRQNDLASNLVQFSMNQL